jgi:TfoX/Sxy family transcriptional regulator of competence genes
MATAQGPVDFVLDLLAAVGDVSARKMFGEYGVYSAGRMVALICDDQLFVKPTEGGRKFAGAIAEASPYPGAKPCLLIGENQIEDAKWLCDLIKISAPELPLPAKKKPNIKP